MIRSASAAALLAALAAMPPIALAQAGSGDARTVTAEAPGPTYADLVALADGAPLVIHAQVRRQAVVEAERAPGLAPGHARLYVQAETRSLLSGIVPVGESLRYLVDVPLTERGKVPKIAKRDVVLFARPVAGRPGEVQLVAPDAQLPYTPALETRLRPILAVLLAPTAPSAITGVAEALAVEGTLAGESETQLFLTTAAGTPVSVTVVRRPGQEPRWGVSWSEIVDQAASPPARGTLGWYRLACALPPELPASAVVADEGEARALAMRDYAFVIDALGPCERSTG